MKKLTLFVFALLLSGCIQSRPFIYQKSEKIGDNLEKLPVVIAIRPFEDLRPTENKASLACFFPIVPYCEGINNRPENSESMSKTGFKASETITNALLEEIKQNNIFNDVYISQRANEPDAKYLITGKIKATYIESHITFYGLSVMGDLLWLLGLPAGNYKLNFDMTMDLVDNSSKQVLSTHEIKGNKEVIFGMYYNRGLSPMDDINAVMQKGLHEGVDKFYKAARALK